MFTEKEWTPDTPTVPGWYCYTVPTISLDVFAVNLRDANGRLVTVIGDEVALWLGPLPELPVNPDKQAAPALMLDPEAG